MFRGARFLLLFAFSFFNSVVLFVFCFFRFLLVDVVVYFHAWYLLIRVCCLTRTTLCLHSHANRFRTSKLCPNCLEEWASYDPVFRQRRCTCTKGTSDRDCAAALNIAHIALALLVDGKRPKRFTRPTAGATKTDTKRPSAGSPARVAAKVARTRDPAQQRPRAARSSGTVLKQKRSVLYVFGGGFFLFSFSFALRLLFLNVLALQGQATTARQRGQSDC
jgi:hypothetical protein